MAASSQDSASLEARASLAPATESASPALGNGGRAAPRERASEAAWTSSLRTPDPFTSPMDFSTVTVQQLGITPQSFVKSSAGKSPSSRIKFRRRSTIGARGSPETSHLIRFIAHQKLKNAVKSPLVLNSPCQHSPGLYRNVNSLRERMSAFQSAFHSIKEDKKMTGLSEFLEGKEDCETTDSAKKKSVDKYPKFEFPAKLASKRRRISSQSNSEEKSTDTALGLLKYHIASAPNTDKSCTVETSLEGFSEKFSEPCLSQSGYLAEESAPLSDITEASLGMKVANFVEGRGSNGVMEVSKDTALEIRSLVTPLCKKEILPSDTIVLRSVLKKPSVKLYVESLQEHCGNLCEDGIHPNVISKLTNCCKEGKTESGKEPASLNMKKRKRVTFGEDLSPEVFDESLPANTPLRKGGTPVCRKDLSSISPLVLAQAPVALSLPQPNFDDDDDDDKGENLENIEPLQGSFAVVNPLHKSSISETHSGTDTFNSLNNQENISSNKVGRVTRTSNRKKQLVGCAEESICDKLNIEAQPRKEKKIKRKISQENKNTDRTLPKKNQAVKSGKKKKGRGKKTAQKSLYGERDIASKKPLLSPIPELPEFVEQTPSIPSIQSMGLGDVISKGELEEVNIPERKNLWLENLVNKHDASESCSVYTKSSSLTVSTFDQDTNKNIRKVHGNQNILKAEIKLEGENKLETGPENESSPTFYNSVVEQNVSYRPKQDLIRHSQEFSTAGQNVKHLQSSEDIKIKCDKQDDFLGTRKGKLQVKHSVLDSQKEIDCSQEGSNNVKESQSEELRRDTIENSGISCRERKQRRRSMCHSATQKIHSDKSGSQQPGVSSSVGTGLENPDLYKDLSHAIEQTFQRASRETKVRRSTRLQKDLANEGLMWISLPFPSAPSTAPQNKRRTISAIDSKGSESMSLRKEAVSSKQIARVSPGIPGKENREGFATSSSPPGRRRRSFCTSTLCKNKNPNSVMSFKRKTCLNHRKESSGDN